MIRSLIQRRVPHILGLYLGGCWIVVEFISFLTTHYLLSDSLIDVTLIAVLGMVPTVLLVAWFHGTPGKDEWVTTEKVLVPLNALLIVGVIVMLFHGQELGATTTTITATDEDGQTVTRIAPKASQRRSLAMFFFDNNTGDAALDWLNVGYSLMLQRDMEQNPFISAWSPYDSYEQSGFLDLKRAGFADGVKVPVALMRQIAQRRDLPLMLTGSYRLEAGEHVIEAALYQVSGATDPRRLAARGASPMAAVDALSKQVMALLDIPSGAAGLAPDLPVSEHFSSHLQAVQHYVEGMQAITLHNDMTGGLALLGEATDADPSFATAHLVRTVRAFNEGRSDLSVAAAVGANQHEYKLLPSERFILKAMNYLNADRADKLLSVYETWAELYPDSINAHAHLAYSYLYHGNESQKALAEFERILELNRRATWALLQSASIHQLHGNNDEARRVLQEYIADNPENYQVYVALGDIDLGAGRLDLARKSFERSVLLGSGRVDPILRIADLELREGHFEAALQRIEEARSVASVPAQESAVLRAEIDFFEQRGQLAELADRLDKVLAVDSQFRGQVNVLMMTLVDFARPYVLAGRAQVLKERLAKMEADLQPPVSELVQIGYLVISLMQGERDEAVEFAQRVRAVTEQFQRSDMEYLNDLADARIHELRGDMAAAIRAAESSLERFGTSFQSIETEVDRIEIVSALSAYRLKIGDTAGARRALERPLRLYPAHPVLNLLLAEAALAQGDKVTAAESLLHTQEAWEGASETYVYLPRMRAVAAALE